MKDYSDNKSTSYLSSGRKLTDQGRTDLTRIAAQVAKKRKAVAKA